MTRTVFLSLLLLATALGLTGTETAQAASRFSSGEAAADAVESGAGQPAAPRFAKAMLDLDENRLADGLEAYLDSLGETDSVQVIVSLTAPGRARAFMQQIGSFIVTHEYEIIDGFAATMTVAQVRQLAALPGIFRVEEDLKAQSLLDVSRMSVGVDAVASLGTGYDGSGVTVCVIDSGVMGSHEMFTPGASGSRIVDFIDYVGTEHPLIDPLAPYDDNFLSHGTHVTGTIGGDGSPDGVGSEGLLAQGVAPGVDFLIARTMDQLGRGLVSDIVLAIEWCRNNNADIINLSLGVPGASNCSDALCNAAQNAVTQDDIVVVAAVGNSGDNTDTAFSPANSGVVIAVGAAAEYVDYQMDSGLYPDGDGRLSGGLHPLGSNSQGPGLSGSIKPDVIAPGETMLSAANNEYSEAILGGGGETVIISNLTRGCGASCYTFSISGSSQAAAFVSGIAALMLEADPTLLPADVQDILQSTADDRLVIGPDNITGYGMVNAYAAVADAAGLTPDSGVTVFPAKDQGSITVPPSPDSLNPVFIDVPIEILDPNLSLGITLAIEGTAIDILGVLTEWEPDVDAWLYYGDTPAPGNLIAFSGCPAATCGTQSAAKVGQMEILGIIFTPGDPVFSDTRLTLRLQSIPTPPFHPGAGGIVNYDISNGRVITNDPPNPVVADAGPDRTVNANKKGTSRVTLDGSGSSGPIDSYSWSWQGGAAFGSNPTVTLPEGQFLITLQVSDGANIPLTSSDQVLITVDPKSSGGGGPGGGGNGGGGGSCGKKNKPPCPE